jgi:hypothetical protein
MGMARLLTSLALAMATLGPELPAEAQADPLGALAGHWTCSRPGRPAAQRSIFMLRTTGPAEELFEREDAVEPDGSPSVSFERITRQGAEGATVSAVEGTGTAKLDERAALRFTGRSFDDAAPFGLTYALAGDTLRRTATRGTATIDEERCTREPDKPIPATCERPDAPAITLHALEPSYPAEAIATNASGLIQVRVVLDDRSNVVWADILRSTTPVFNTEAVRAARGSTYRTALHDCRPVPAQYVFSVDFSTRR